MMVIPYDQYVVKERQLFGKSWMNDPIERKGNEEKKNKKSSSKKKEEKNLQGK